MALSPCYLLTTSALKIKIKVEHGLQIVGIIVYNLECRFPAVLVTIIQKMRLVFHYVTVFQCHGFCGFKSSLAYQCIKIGSKNVFWYGALGGGGDWVNSYISSKGHSTVIMTSYCLRAHCPPPS